MEYHYLAFFLLMSLSISYFIMIIDAITGMFMSMTIPCEPFELSFLKLGMLCLKWLTGMFLRLEFRLTDWTCYQRTLYIKFVFALQLILPFVHVSNRIWLLPSTRLLSFSMDVVLILPIGKGSYDLFTYSTMIHCNRKHCKCMNN